MAAAKPRLIVAMSTWAWVKNIHGVHVLLSVCIKKQRWWKQQLLVIQLCLACTCICMCVHELYTRVWPWRCPVYIIWEFHSFLIFAWQILSTHYCSAPGAAVTSWSFKAGFCRKQARYIGYEAREARRRPKTITFAGSSEFVLHIQLVNRHRYMCISFYEILGYPRGISLFTNSF
jgi:hypothetical protein